MAIRVLIVEANSSEREKIKRMLRQETDIEIIGECADGEKSVLPAEKFQPDLIFLEIELPDGKNFEIPQKSKFEKKPFVICISKSEKFAVRAFEIGAADYLVKPFGRERLKIAVEKVREQIYLRQKDSLEKIFRNFFNKFSAEKNFPDKIMLKTAKGVYFINTNEIDWIEAAGNYVKLHVKDSGYLMRETMNNIEAKLNPDNFLRIHRSSLVNIDRIKELQPLFNGDYIVILRDNTELNLSRNFHDRLQRLFDKFS